MKAIAAKTFSAVEYIQRLRQVEFTEAQAEVVAAMIEQQSQAIQEQNSKISSLESKELATKGDVRESELRLLKEIEMVRGEIKSFEVKLMLIYGGGFLLILGVLAKGFHWL